MTCSRVRLLLQRIFACCSNPCFAQDIVIGRDLFQLSAARKVLLMLFGQKPLYQLEADPVSGSEIAEW